MSDKSKREGLAVQRVAWVGLIGNLTLCGIKFVAGVAGRSQAVVADAVHSLSDSVTDIAVIVGARYWTRDADADHPYGHRRIETLVTIFVGSILVIAGLGVGWRAIVSFRGGEQDVPGSVALIAALISVVCKELLYRWTVIRSMRLASASLKANALHHRSDAFSSIPAAVAVACALFFPEWQFLDAIGAIVVSVFIFHAAYMILRPALSEITEHGAPPQVRARVEEIAASIDGVEEIHGFRSRYVGSYLLIDLHALVNAAMRVDAAHEIATAISRRVMEELDDVKDVVVHIEPKS